ncbi:MAG TPA: antitoxin Xre/MbcA/ParS toxin-binding domain-containing protein [Vicinamibacterales bacterium]|nr:antitoxin Xre/MbcA/ParS toxin-binding domain-containing protein [Vicinamibacterales bacterium]
MPGASTLSRSRTLTRDLERFTAFLGRGAPGPHAHVVLLGLDAFESDDLLRAVQKGLPYRALERLRRNTALPLARIIDVLGIPRRTLSRRKREGRFLPDESDRLLRVSRLFGRALALFEGDREAALEWLTARQPAFGGVAPLDMARTELGAREVERLIGRLEHGVFS